MAVDIFLKIGDVKGESKDDKYKDWIQVESVSYGIVNHGSHGVGGGGGTGKADFQDIHITKAVDKATADLSMHCATGEHFKDAQIIFRKSGDGGKPLDYLKIKLTEVSVTSIQSSGGGGNNIVHESLSLNFSKFESQYFTQKADGSGEPGGNVGWNLKEQKKV
jgi:type VI secretion system secreted protein Hcp